MTAYGLEVRRLSPTKKQQALQTRYSHLFTVFHFLLKGAAMNCEKRSIAPVIPISLLSMHRNLERAGGYGRSKRRKFGKVFNHC